MFADHRTHSQRAFEDGGAVNRGPGGCLITDLSVIKQNLETLGLPLNECYDTGSSEQKKLTLGDGTLDPVILAAAAEDRVWTRQAKVPDPAKHPLCVLRRPPDSAPIRQKPYRVPHKYVEAVRQEIDGLLKANLIEPGAGDWCSPVLCIIKKDSTSDTIKLRSNSS